MPRGKKYPNMQKCLRATNAQIKQKMLKNNKCSLKGKNALRQKMPKLAINA
jgi:hypothetical protein